MEPGEFYFFKMGEMMKAHSHAGDDPVEDNNTAMKEQKDNG